MKAWLKFFFGGFFIDRFGKEAGDRRFLNGILGFILAYLVITAVLIAGYAASFSVHYRGAEDFRGELYARLGGETKLSVKDGKLYSEPKLEEFGADGGIHIILDTRPSKTTFDDFTLFFVKGDEKISYESYLALPENARADYKMSLERSGRAIVFTDELIAGYEEFIISGEHADSLDRISHLKTEDYGEYCSLLYCLYVQLYYPPEVAKLDTYAAAPTVKSYYLSYFYANAEADGQFVILMDDLVIANFRSQKGVWVTYVGNYGGMSDGDITGEKGIDGLMSDTFYSVSGTNALMYFVNVARYLPIAAAFVLVFALLLFLTIKFVFKGSTGFFVSLKMVCAYQLMSAVLASIVGFILAFVLARTQTYLFTLIVYAAALFLRTAVFAVFEGLRLKKERADAEADADGDGAADGESCRS